MRLYVIYYFSHSCNFLCIFIRDFQVKLVFKLHYKLNYVERVSAEVIFEASFQRNFGFICAEAVNDDAFDAIQYFGHPVHLLLGIIRESQAKCQRNRFILTN